MTTATSTSEPSLRSEAPSRKGGCGAAALSILRCETRTSKFAFTPAGRAGRHGHLDGLPGRPGRGRALHHPHRSHRQWDPARRPAQEPQRADRSVARPSLRSSTRPPARCRSTATRIDAAPVCQSNTMSRARTRACPTRHTKAHLQALTPESHIFPQLWQHLPKSRCPSVHMCSHVSCHRGSTNWLAGFPGTHRGTYEASIRLESRHSGALIAFQTWQSGSTHFQGTQP